MDKLFIVLDAKLRVVASLHENLRAADRLKLFDFFEDLFSRPQITLFHIAGLTVECAKLAISIANVRVIDVAIHQKRRAILGPRVFTQIELVCNRSQLKKIRLLKKMHALLDRYAAAL